jgi:hypothetical protein
LPSTSSSGDGLNSNELEGARIEGESNTDEAAPDALETDVSGESHASGDWTGSASIAALNVSAGDASRPDDRALELTGNGDGLMGENAAGNTDQSSDGLGSTMGAISGPAFASVNQP